MREIHQKNKSSEKKADSSINRVDDADSEDTQIDPPGWDPTKSPGEGWEWRGRPNSQPGDQFGSWHNPDTGESLHPDLDHPEGIKPHWDYTPGKGKPKVRIDPDSGRPLSPEPKNDTLGNMAKAGVATGGAIVAVIVAKKVAGVILAIIPEPITSGVGLGLIFTP
ncbi:MAG: hypothetical protein JXR70_03750 [Spirochaetales bacterium]|nr:hypothetical protein [Spirochaetales bacterium]